MQPKNSSIPKKSDWYYLFIFFFVSFAVYLLSLKNYFINDDLIQLDFIKTFKGNYLDFLFPHLAPSDLIMKARYEPFHIYFYTLLYKPLHTFFPAYQFLNLTFHSLNTFLIYRIGKKINIQPSGAFFAALFFCVSRLNSQNILWYSCLFYTFACSLLLLAFLLFLSDAPKSYFYSALLFFISALLTLKAPQYLLLTGSYLLIFRKEIILKSKMKIFLVYSAVLMISVLGNLISLHYFPHPLSKFQFDGFGLLAFFLNLTFPYEGGFLLKVSVLLLLLAAVLIQRKDKIVSFLTLSIFTNSLFWFVFSSATLLPYAPRYFYVSAALFSLLLGHFVSLGLQTASSFKKRAVILFTVLFMAFNSFLIVSQDIVWFQYLSIRAQKLAKLSELPAPGKKKVYIKDDFFSDDPNLDYFKDKLDFTGEESGVYSIDLERAKYVNYFRHDFGNQYWFQPWFLKTPCDKDNPWC